MRKAEKQPPHVEEEEDSPPKDSTRRAEKPPPHAEEEETRLRKRLPQAKASNQEEGEDPGHPMNGNRWMPSPNLPIQDFCCSENVYE